MGSWSIQPRLSFEIGWQDLVSTLRPADAEATSLAAIRSLAPADAEVVVGLSVRTLFDALLSESEATKSGLVAATAINIAGMAALIDAHGRRLRAVDVRSDTLAAEDTTLVQASSGAAMVLIAHLYGVRSAVPSIPFGPLVVEDCAQAFDGRLRVSPHADVALYSFGPIKTQTALGGAVALVKDPDLAARLRRRLAAHPPLDDGWFLRRVLKYAILKSLSEPLVFGAVYRLAQRFRGDPDALLGGLARGFGSKGDMLAAIRRRPPPRLLGLLARRLRAPPPPRVAAQAFMVDASASTVVPGAAAPDRHWWLCPVLVEDPDTLRARLIRQGFDATRGATSLGVMGDEATPQARRIIRQVVYVPRPDTVASARALSRALAASLPANKARETPR